MLGMELPFSRGAERVRFQRTLTGLATGSALLVAAAGSAPDPAPPPPLPLPSVLAAIFSVSLPIAASSPLRPSCSSSACTPPALKPQEADSIGLQLMSIACYDPTVAPRVFEKLGQAAKGLAPPEWLSTHPSDKKRAAALAVKVPEAVRRYEGAGCGHHHHHGFFGGSLGSALGEESPRLR